MLRRFLIPALIALSVGSSMVLAEEKRPDNLQPLPEVPPPPVVADEASEPQVTITKRGDDQVAEYRVNGRLYMMKVTPPSGKPYYLIDHKGDGKWVRQEDTGGRLSVPMWVITTF